MIEEVRLVNVLKTARNWAINRLNELKKPFHSLLRKNTFKANEKLFIREVILSCVMGEMSALERFLQVIIDNPEMNRADIEAELHLSIKDYNNYLSNKIGQKDLQITLDDYLKIKEYLK